MSRQRRNPWLRLGLAVGDGKRIAWERLAARRPRAAPRLAALHLLERIARAHELPGADAPDPAFEALAEALAGRYTLGRAVGRGGMATVLLADDVKHGRRVAIKVMHPHIAAEIGSKQFRREIEIAARLTHPHILPLHDSGEAAGQLYYVMPFIAGESLRARLQREGRLPVPEVLRLASEIGSGLGYAHHHGLVHRDVKPENVLLADGIALVADFGIARVTAPGLVDAHSTLGVGVGTPSYMAPEQILGLPVEARTDVYALGCVVFEMLTGHTPFQGAAEQVMALHTSAAPPSPRAERADVPAGLDAVVVRALAKVPPDRPPSMADFVEALTADGTGPAERLAGRAERTPQPGAPRPPAAALLGGASGARHGAGRTFAIRGAIAVAALLAVVVIAWTMRTRPWLASAGGGIQSLAVLPLENLSGDASQQYFTDGVTEELINHLSQIAALRVISRTSVMSLRGTHQPVTEIARRLHVDAIVEGSVARAGDRVRLTAELVQAAPERQLWAQTLERQVGDVLAIPGQLAGIIADELRLRLSPQERARVSHHAPVATAAHEEYLRGRFHLVDRDERSYRAALMNFQRAVQIDSTYAEAWAGIADANYCLSNIYLPPSIAMPAARAAAQRALRIDPDLAAAHASLGVIHYAYDRDWDGAERELRHSLALNPSLEQAHLYYGYLLEATGRFDAALVELRAATALNPLSGETAAEAIWPYYLAGANDRAIAAWQALMKRDGESPVLLYNLGMSYEAERRYPEAIASLQKAVRMADFDFPLALLGHAYGRAGRQREAREVIDRLHHGPGNISSMYFAIVFAGLGERDSVFSYLDRALQNRDEDLDVVAVDPKFAPVRDDPRFHELLRRLNLESLVSGWAMPTPRGRPPLTTRGPRDGAPVATAL